YKPHFRGIVRRIPTALNFNHGYSPVNVVSLKPLIARVRQQRLTNFYPLAYGQPHPLCALRRNLFREHAPSV
ncbi:hypothetical protein, partial [Paraburkholderia sp. Cpub6]|uniref:hypothetical protein n=1 Tax=Paraburkholderia sp. Cpub6 TaxID=2723094 RepID=UPI0018229FB1